MLLQCAQYQQAGLSTSNAKESTTQQTILIKRYIYRYNSTFKKRIFPFAHAFRGCQLLYTSYRSRLASTTILYARYPARSSNRQAGRVTSDNIRSLQCISCWSIRAEPGCGDIYLFYISICLEIRIMSYSWIVLFSSMTGFNVRKMTSLLPLLVLLISLGMNLEIF